MSQASKAVFLSYASQDAEAARRICDALRAAGIEVWFDQSELVGGDAWDAKIRGQIQACALFVPVISANTQARREGYFRLEWRQADQRTHLMSHDRAFLVPVVVDDTNEQNARVPESFLAVQWSRLPGGEATSQFCERVRALLESGSGVSPAIAEHGRPVRPAQGFEPVEGDARAMPGSGTLALAARRARGRRLPLLFAIAALIGGSAALWQWQAEDPEAEQPEVRHFAVQQNAATAKAATARTPLDFASAKSVAVLAFANLSGDKENEYFSDGISEELLNVLAKVPGLRVAARTSAFYFKGKNATAQEIGQKLGVAHLVDGSVRRAGTKVRIAARLSKSETGEQLWSESFERELKDIFALQDEIARDIAAKLQVTLGGVAAKREVNPEAHRLVLEGLHFLGQRTVAGIARAETSFSRALELDPSYAGAHAAFARWWREHAWQRHAAPAAIAAGIAQGERYSARASELDPADPAPQAELGWILLLAGKLAGSERAFARALSLNPNHAFAHHGLGWLRMRQGALEDAVAEYSKARDLDPLDWSKHDNLGWALLHLRRFSEGLAASERAHALAPGTPIIDANRSVALLGLGRMAEAVTMARGAITRADSSNFDPGMVAMNHAIAAWVLAEAGERNDATKIVTRILAGPADRRALAGFVLIGLEKRGEAFAVLAEMPQFLVPLLWLVADRHQTRSGNAPLLDDPGFLQLLQKLDASEGFQTSRATLARMLKEQAAKK